MDSVKEQVDDDMEVLVFRSVSTKFADAVRGRVDSKVTFPVMRQVEAQATSSLKSQILGASPQLAIW